MNRSAKGFRVAGSIFILLNLAAFFFPFTERTQENYATLSWHQLDYIRSMFEGYLPYGEKMKIGITTLQKTWIICLIILPILLSLTAGIWGIVGNYRQGVSIVLAVVILGFYIGMTASIDTIWPAASEGQVYSKGIACMLHLICSGCGAAASIIALLCTPKEVNVVKKVSIPQVEEVKQQKVEAKYNIIMENAAQVQPKPAYDPSHPRGVLVGLSGIYKGAEIPLTDGEYIKLGRQTNNHLIFEGQPNVSRNHCRIKWDSKRLKYIFCDYSSNGSFVNGSDECLPQNLEIEMNPGTVVAIGDETNTFRLE